MPTVGLLRVELAHLTSQVIRGTGVEVPGSINWVIWSVARVVVSDSSLFLVATPIIADVEEVTFEATIALRREVPEYATELASGTLVSAGVGGRRGLPWLPLTRATSRRARGRAGCRDTTATRGTAVGHMSRRVDDDWRSTSCLDVLLSVHEAGVKVTRWHRVVAVVHHLDEVRSRCRGRPKHTP
jgi:hypothetical protein